VPCAVEIKRSSTPIVLVLWAALLVPTMHYHLATALAVLPFLATAWPTIYGRPGLDGANYTGLFAPGLSSNASIHYTTDRDYNTSVTQPWSFWSQPTYSVSIKPATVADVQYIVGSPARRVVTIAKAVYRSELQPDATCLSLPQVESMAARLPLPQ
jgi:hypothetical protein